MMENNQKPGKQHTAEFEQCIKQVMKQGHEKGSAFAICTATFEKARKPIFIGESEAQKLHLFSESIKLSGNKVSGVAIHPKRIFHPEFPYWKPARRHRRIFAPASRQGRINLRYL